MVKKNSPEPEEPPAAPMPPFDNPGAKHIRDSAQQIWLAGMGAFSKVQAEGRQVFEALVKEGSSLQKKTQAVAEERLDDVAGKVSSLAGDVSAKAGQHWDKLEGIFEERTAKALKRLGVPAMAELDALSARIDALTEEVRQLSAVLAEITPSSQAREETADPEVPGRRSHKPA